jgi:hypothetical protein
MGWTFYSYLFSNIGIAVGILAIIAGFLIFLVCKYDNVFYKLVKIMFHIKLKYPDEQPNEDGEDENTNVQKNEKTTVVVLTTTKEAFVNPPQSSTTIIETTAPNNSTQETPSDNRKLNLYGKTIDAEKTRNKIMLTIIIIGVIGASCIAGVQGCLLANITVYPNGPCPHYGVMDCYGKNDTYFNCTPGTQTDSTLFTDSATCFRWIARDTTVNDVMTQVGVCTGLLHAFCAIVQVLLRFLLYAWSEHPQTPEEAAEEAKTAAAMSTNQTANTTEGKEDSNKTKYTYEHPVLIFISTLALILIPLLAIITAVLLGVFRVSITALTYVVLVAIVVVCCFTIIWIAMEDDDKLAGQTSALTTIIPLDDDEPKQDTTKNKERTQHNGFKQNVIKDFKIEDVSPISDIFLGTEG